MLRLPKLDLRRCLTNDLLSIQTHTPCFIIYKSFDYFQKLLSSYYIHCM